MDTAMNGIRSGDRKEFHPLTEVEKFLAETVEKHYSESGYSSSEFYFCHEKRITIGMVKTPEMADNFNEFCTAFAEKITPKMEEKGFKVITIENEMFFTFEFIHESMVRRLAPNPELQKSIENIISDNYAEVGFESTAQVTVDDKKEVHVYFNSEKPYIGTGFWDFLSNTVAEVRNYLQTQGYHYKNGKWFYDFWIVHFEYQG